MWSLWVGGSPCPILPPSLPEGPVMALSEKAGAQEVGKVAQVAETHAQLPADPGVP